MTKTYKTVTENFKTLDEFLEITQQRPLNAVFKGEIGNLSSERDESHKKGGYWSGTANYKDAETIMMNGYREPLEKMKNAILKIGQKENHAKPRTFRIISVIYR
jgi:hypothetical protein